MTILVGGEILQLWPWLEQYAARWLQVCGLSTATRFNQWAAARGVVALPFDKGLLLVDDIVPGCRIRVHPLASDKSFFRERSRIRQIMRELMLFFQAERLEIRVLENSGHTLRRVLREVGFTQEGILRQHEVNHLSPTRDLISCEVWSILRMEIMEV